MEWDQREQRKSAEMIQELKDVSRLRPNVYNGSKVTSHHTHHLHPMSHTPLVAHTIHGPNHTHPTRSSQHLQSGSMEKLIKISFSTTKPETV